MVLVLRNYINMEFVLNLFATNSTVDIRTGNVIFLSKIVWRFRCIPYFQETVWFYGRFITSCEWQLLSVASSLLHQFMDVCWLAKSSVPATGFKASEDLLIFFEFLCVKKKKEVKNLHSLIFVTGLTVRKHVLQMIKLFLHSCFFNSNEN